MVHGIAWGYGPKSLRAPVRKVRHMRSYACLATNNPSAPTRSGVTNQFLQGTSERQELWGSPPSPRFPNGRQDKCVDYTPTHTGSGSGDIEKLGSPSCPQGSLCRWT